MGKKLTQKQFIEKAIKIHGNLFSYTHTEYVDSKSKVIIGCKKHGNFLQTPNAHLSGVGCAKCHFDNMELSTEEFIEKANKVHNSYYDYTKTCYKGCRSKVIITCKLHGDFEQNVSSHIEGFGCKKCTFDKKRYTLEEFINKANKIHNNRYSYTQTNYIDSKKKIRIICNIHGHFNQTPKNHLQGNGCPKCSRLSSWGQINYVKKANGRLCTFYIIHCFNKEEEFYKIGITLWDIKRRYSGITRMPYNYEIISEIHGEAGDIWDLELQEKRKLKEFNYQPNIKFKGSKTECFTQYKI